jgi:hypothetical protein
MRNNASAMSVDASRSGFLKRITLCVLALCALSPLTVSAHRDHGAAPALAQAETVHAPRQETADSRATAAVEVAPLPCPGGNEHACGCHSVSCGPAADPGVVGPALPGFLTLPSPDAAVLPRSGTDPPSLAPLPPFPPRAPPVSS